MATKLSAVSQKTGTNADDLIYLASTSDSGSTYESKAIKISNLFSSVASGTDLGTFTGSTLSDNASVKTALQELETALETEASDRATAISTAVANLVDSSPSTLNTLNELAQALNDDPSFATTVTNLIAANEVHIDNNVATLGITKDDQDLGTFTGGTIADSSTVKAALQSLETALEAADSLTDLGVTSTAAELNKLDGCVATTTQLNYLQGVTGGVQTQLDTKVADGDNVNNLVASTTPDTTPASFYFLTVDAATGAIKVVDKNFVEVE